MFKNTVGGGFRMPEITGQNSNRKGELLATLDWEIEKLKSHSTQVAGHRLAHGTEPLERPPQTLQEIEQLRLANKERLKVLEDEYRRQRTNPPVTQPTDLLQQVAEYKAKKQPTQPPKKTGWSQYKRTDEPSDNRVILLKWIFARIDKDGSGSIDKYELMQEVAKHPETAAMLGLPYEEDFDRMLEKVVGVFESVGKDGLIGLDEFVVFMLGRPNIPQQVEPVLAPKPVKETEAPLTMTFRKPDGLTDAQVRSLERVFKDLDIHKDQAILKFDFIQTLKVDPQVNKFLHTEVFCSEERSVTLEDILDRILDDGGSHDFITFSQFLDLIEAHKPVKVATLAKSVIPAEEPVNEAPLNPLYSQILLDIFDSLPRRATEKVATSEFVEAVTTDPQASEFIHETLGGRVTVEEAMTQMKKQGGAVVSWKDICGFLRGQPKFTAHDQKVLSQHTFHSVRAHSAKPPAKSKPSSNSAKKFTVPMPFKFDSREQTKEKTIRQRKVEEIVMQKQLEEQYHLHYRPRANDPPAEVMIPKYESMLAAQEARRLEVKRNSKATTEKLQQPFSFYYRDQQKKKTESQIEKPPQFKARPPPPSTHTKVFEQLKFQEEERKKRIEEAAKKLLEESKMPSRMEAWSASAGQKQSAAGQSSTQFKAKPAPNFQTLQSKFSEQLEQKKSSFKPTEIKEFNFAETKPRSKPAEDPLEIGKQFMKGLVAKPAPVEVEPPKITNIQRKQQELREAKRKEEEQARERQAKAEEEKRLKHAQARQRVVQSGTIAPKSEASLTRSNFKATNDKFRADLEEMKTRVNSKPLMTSTISSTNQESRSLYRIKQMMKERGLPESGLVYENGELDDIPAESLV